jgi:hypothetical protein
MLSKQLWRWVLVLPVAIVAGVAGSLTGGLVAMVFGQAAMDTASAFVGPAAFVFVAGLVAPSHRNKVGFAAAFLVAILALGTVVLSTFTDIEEFTRLSVRARTLTPVAQCLGALCALLILRAVGQGGVGEKAMQGTAEPTRPDATELFQRFYDRAKSQGEEEYARSMLSTELELIANDSRLSEAERKEAIKTLSRVLAANEPNPQGHPKRGILNKWQRTWVVVSALWLLPVFVVGWVAVQSGNLDIYTPPKLQEWSLTCQLTSDGGDGPNVVNVPSVGNVQFPASFSRSDMTTVAERLQNAEAPDGFIAEGRAGEWTVWLPAGSDGRSIQCSDLGSSFAYIYNPLTQKAELPVFARLDGYGSFHRGYDALSALEADTADRIAQSQSRRMQMVGLLLGAGFGVPAFIYVLGAAIAWIRRG